MAPLADAVCLVHGDAAQIAVLVQCLQRFHELHWSVTLPYLVSWFMNRRTRSLCAILSGVTYKNLTSKSGLDISKFGNQFGGDP